MQVDFEYPDGRVVRMARQYADVLRRIGKGRVVSAKPEAPVGPKAKATPKKAK